MSRPMRCPGAETARAPFVSRSTGRLSTGVCRRAGAEQVCPAGSVVSAAPQHSTHPGSRLVHADFLETLGDELVLSARVSVVATTLTRADNNYTHARAIKQESVNPRACAWWYLPRRGCSCYYSRAYPRA